MGRKAGAEESDSLRVWCECSHLDPLGRRLGAQETVSVPWVKHSHKISIEHPKISGEFEVKKVITKTDDSGFIRTSIYF